MAARLGWNISLSSPQCPTFCCSLRQRHPHTRASCCQQHNIPSVGASFESHIWACSFKPWLAGTGQAVSWNGNRSACRKAGGSWHWKQETGLCCPEGLTQQSCSRNTVITGRFLLLSHLFLLHPVVLLVIGLKGTHQASSHFFYNGNFGHIWVSSYLFQLFLFHCFSACNSTGNNTASLQQWRVKCKPPPAKHTSIDTISGLPSLYVGKPGVMVGKEIHTNSGEL